MVCVIMRSLQSLNTELAGYYVYLQAGKTLWGREDSPTVAMFLAVDQALTGTQRVKHAELTCFFCVGIVPEQGFFVQTQSQISFFNNITGGFQPTHLPANDTFTTGIHELGYFDVFKKRYMHHRMRTSVLIDVV